MLIPFFADVAARADWSLGSVAIAVVIIVALIAVVMIATRAMGVAIPQWVWQIIGVCVIAFVAVLALKFLIGL